MSNGQHRQDVTDEVWAKIEPYFPGQKGQWGRVADDNRRFFNGTCWILRTGAPWRDLPDDYGKFGSVHKRFKRFCDHGIWDKILEQLIDEPDFEWLMIDESHCKVPPHAAGAIGGNQDMERTKGGSIPKYILPWMRMVCRLDSLSQRVPQRIVDLLYRSFGE
jgi:transposase